MYQNIINAVLNTVFVSIPEVAIWTIFVLILSKRKDLLDIYRWKHGIKQIMIVTIPTAASINLMRYILQVDNLINFIIIEVMMCVLVIYIVKKNNFLNEKISYVKIIMFILLVDFIIIFMTEFFCVIISMFILNIDITNINSNITLNILLSIVPRLLQISVILYVFYKKNFDEKISIYKLVLENKIVSISFIVFTITLILITFVFSRTIMEMFCSNNLLFKQIFIVILALYLPIILLLSYIVSISNLLYKNIKLQQEKNNIFNIN
jgi:hypothetical protein